MSTSVIVGKRAVSRGRMFFGFLWTVLAAIVLFGAGCTDSASPGAGGGGLVLGANEAWTDGDMGYIFLQNGQFVPIQRQGSTWYGEVVGTWSVSGNIVTIVAGGQSITATYSIYGNELTYTSSDFGDGVLTRTSGINVVIEGEITPPSPARSTSLTENVWTYGSITSSTPDRAVWYQFNVVSGRTYWVSWDDKYSGPQTGTLDVKIDVVYSDGTIILMEDDWGGCGEDTVGPDEPNYSTPVLGKTMGDDCGAPPSFTANRSGTVQIRVTPYYPDETGTFGVMYTTSNPGGGGGGNPGGGGGNPGGGTVTGGNVVNGANQAWTATPFSGYTMGYIFQANNGFTLIVKEGGIWYEVADGTYSTSGGNITMTIDGSPMTGTYSVSGNTLTITSGGETVVFTRTSGIIVESIPGEVEPPNNPTTTPTPLTENAWTYGSITSSTPDRAVWYSFNVVSGQRYYVLWDDENSGPRNGTLDIKIRASYSDGAEIFTGDDMGSTPESFTASRSGTVQIRIIPYSSYGTGTFGVMYTTTDPNAPPPNNPTLTPLAENVWTYGSITSSTPNRTASYSFNVVSGQRYYVFWDDIYSGPGNGTLDVEITVVYSDGTEIFYGDDMGSTPESFTANRSGTVQIRVTPLNSYDTGTFGVMYTTTSPNGGGGGTGGNLILGANEAWVATIEGETIGFIFKTNGDLIEIFYVDDYGYGSWYGYVAGWWSTSGSNITLALDYYDEIVTGVYTVSGNTATIIIEGEPMTFTKTGNIIYEDLDYYLMKSPNSGENPLKKIWSQKQSSLLKKSSPSKKTLPLKKPSTQKKPVSPGKLSWGK